MQPTMRLLLASCLAGFVAGAIVDETTCLEGYGWMKNAKDQSPCLVSAYLQAQCQSGNWTMKALPAGVVYSAPDGAYLTACACSEAAYNAISACSACQGGSWLSWPQYSDKCTPSLFSTGGWPSSVKIPSDTVIPPYALTDVDQWSANKFNVTEALAIAVGPTPTPTAPPPDNSSSLPVGAIVGGTVGGVVGLLILAVVLYLLFCRNKTLDGTNRISKRLSRPQHAPLPSTASGGASPYPLMQQLHRTPSLEAALGGSSAAVPSSAAIPPVSPFTPPPATPSPGRSRSTDTPRGLLTRIGSNRPGHTSRSQSHDITLSSHVRNESPDVLDIAAIRARAHPNNTNPEQIDPYMLPPPGEFIPPRGDTKGRNYPSQQYPTSAADDRMRRGVVDAMNDPSVTWGGSSLGHGNSQAQTSVYAPGHPYGNYSAGRQPSQETFTSQQGSTDLGRYNSQMTSSVGHHRQGSSLSSPTGPPTSYRGRAISPVGPGDYFPPGILYNPSPAPTPYDPRHEHTTPNEPVPEYVPSQHSTPPPEKSARSSAADTRTSDAAPRSSSETRSDKPLKEKQPLPFLNPLPPNERPPTWTDPYAFTPPSEGRPQGIVINDDGEADGPSNGRGPYMRRTLGAVSDSSLIERLASAGDSSSPTVPSPLAPNDNAQAVKGHPEM